MIGRYLRWFYFDFVPRCWHERSIRGPLNDDVALWRGRIREWGAQAEAWLDARAR